MKLSLIVPCYNEAENIELFQSETIKAFCGCGYSYEIIFVDDGSKDATLHQLKKIYAGGKCPMKVVSFSRNFGKESAIYAGLQHASGEYVSLIDADLQQRPEIVREMVSFLDSNPDYDMVAAYQDRSPSSKKAFIRLSTSFLMWRSSRMPAIFVPSAAACGTVFWSWANITASPRASLLGSATTPNTSPIPPVNVPTALPNGALGNC